MADDLGFEHVTHNSIDGASNRDFVLDYLAAASTCAMHLSRLGSEIVIWSSTEFGFCQLDESFSSGSSIMPQKVNPDSAELLRAKSPRVAADYAALLGTMHALPLTYGKDMQEDKEPLFDAIDTVESCLDAAEGMLAGIEFDRERLEDASGDEMLAATEVADLLVRRGVPFREAHGIVGGLVRDAVEQGKPLSELSREELRARSEHARRLLLRGAAAQQLAGVEEDRGRHRLGLAGPPARAGRGDPGRGPSAGPGGAGLKREHSGSGSRAQRLAEPLGADFFDRSVHLVARELIGCRLFYEGVGGTIVETESYERDDPACHAYVGLTERTEVLFGPPGRAYVYLSYGIHSLLNVVAEPEGEAAAVLIRALEPTAGIESMRARRGERARQRPLLGPRQADRGARHRPRRQRRRPLPAIPSCSCRPMTTGAGRS